jgi:transposase
LGISDDHGRQSEEIVDSGSASFRAAPRLRRLREFLATHDWITCCFLLAYAPDLNPVEDIWSLLRRSSHANTVFTDPDHLMRALRHGLREIQYRSNLIDGCLTETGLTMTTSRQQSQ